MIRKPHRHGSPALSQWFTPFWAAEELVEDALRELGDVSIVEPSCGSGAFLAAFPTSCPAFGVEIDAGMVPQAIANSGREVLLGDFRTVDLGGRTIEAVIGNPPFDMAVVDGFLDRAHALLPDDGLVAMILPASAFRTKRVVRWSDRFSLDVNLIPKTLFGKLRDPLIWAKLRKGRPRTFAGLMLFAEQRDVEAMRRDIRSALERPGTWRAAVQLALESLGGAAALADIYEQITPERRVSPHWQPKVRQILQYHFRSVGRGQWALAA